MKNYRGMTRRLMRTFTGEQQKLAIVKVKITDGLEGHKSFLTTLSHLRQYERLHPTRVRWHNDPKLSRRAKELLEIYETYRLHGGKYNVFLYWRKHREIRKDFTPMIFQEVVAWYTEHHSDRIQRMRVRK